MGRCAFWYVWCACIVWAAEPPQSADWDRLITQADAQVRAGNYDRALPLYREALRIAEAFGAGDVRLPATRDFLGNVYAALGMWSQSEREFLLALPMIESIAGRESVTYGLLMLDIGNMFGNSDRLDRAESPMREALAVLARVLPANDSRLAMVRASYAAVLIYRKRYRDAEDLVQEGIAALEKQPNEACGALGSSYNILGLVMCEQGRYEDALALQQQAVNTADACFGPDHPALIKLLNNLAVTFSYLHKTAEAEAMFLRALSLSERNLGSEHPFYGKLLLNYAAFLRQTHRKSEAKKVAARAQLMLRDSARRNGAGLTVDISAFRPQLR